MLKPYTFLIPSSFNNSMDDTIAFGNIVIVMFDICLYDNKYKKQYIIILHVRHDESSSNLIIVNDCR